MRGYDSLPPIILEVIGLTAFVFFCGFWAITGRVAPELLAAAGTLYGTSLLSQAKDTVKPSDEKKRLDDDNKKQ